MISVSISCLFPCFHSRNIHFTLEIHVEPFDKFSGLQIIQVLPFALSTTRIVFSFEKEVPLVQSLAVLYNEVIYQIARATERDEYTLDIFSDYVHRLSENQAMLKYSQRRWDLIHLFGSTITAITIGYIFGITGIIISSAIFGMPNIDNLFIRLYIGIVTLLIIGTILILPLLWKSYNRALREHSLARDILVRDAIENLKKKGSDYWKIVLNDTKKDWDDLYGKRYCAFCGQKISLHSNFCFCCGKNNENVLGSNVFAAIAMV